VYSSSTAALPPKSSPTTPLFRPKTPRSATPWLLALTSTSRAPSTRSGTATRCGSSAATRSSATASRKADLRLLFWSGQSFDEPGLHPEGSFKAAEAAYTRRADVDVEALRRWLAKARDIQWDYQNIVKRKGKLERLK
jgi:hypothetical protein